LYYPFYDIGPPFYCFHPGLVLTTRQFCKFGVSVTLCVWGGGADYWVVCGHSFSKSYIHTYIYTHTNTHTWWWKRILL